MKTLLFAILLITSCRQSAEPIGRTNLEQVDTSNQVIDDDVINQIVDYYQKKMEAQGIDYEVNYELEKTYADSTLNLYYTCQEYVSGHHSVNIGLKSSDFMYGDLDGNGTVDMITTIINEYASSSSNSEIFVFLNQDGKYNFSSAVKSSEICGCDPDFSGRNMIFQPFSIEDGLLIGESFCYGDGDADCCPSILFQTTTMLRDGKLLFKSKTPKE
jgi:hypothetical protein